MNRVDELTHAMDQLEAIVDATEALVASEHGLRPSYVRLALDTAIARGLDRRNHPPVGQEGDGDTTREIHHNLMMLRRQAL